MIALVGAMFVAMGSTSAAPGAVIKFDDSDAVVNDDSQVQVTVEVTDPAAAVVATVDWVRVSGTLKFLQDTENIEDAGLLESNSTLSTNYSAGPPVVAGVTVWGEYTLVIPDGTPDGEYVVSARVDLDGPTGGSAPNETGTGGYVTIRKTLKVGDAGVAVASAEVGLSTVPVPGVDANEDGDFEDLNDGDKAPIPAHTRGNAQDTDTAKQGTPIYLSVRVLNSLGETADNRDVKSVSIIAATGKLGRGAMAPEKGDSLTYAGDSEDATPAADDAVSVTPFSVTKPTAGTLNVYAVVVGTTGAATTNTFPLTFTGSASQITLHAPSSPLGAGGSSTVDVTAEDGSGNVASLGPSQVTANVLNDPGARFKETPNQAPRAGTKNFLTEAPSVATAGSPTADETKAIAEHDAGDCDGRAGDSECDPNKVRIVISAAAGTPAGEYTLQVKLGTDDTEEITIIVAGAPGSIELESSHETVSIGDIITVTATVTDAGGHPVVNAAVADGVSFEAVGSLKLSALRDNDPTKDNDTMVALKDGVATARFLVSQGSGTASIVAEYSASNASVDDVISVSTEAAEAMPEEEASVACLSTLSGFSTWSCGVDSSASEIFGLVSGRGATALHLWNGSAWVRYSVVDGTMVPGSSDFMVTQYDTLYISN